MLRQSVIAKKKGTICNQHCKQNKQSYNRITDTTNKNEREILQQDM